MGWESEVVHGQSELPIGDRIGERIARGEVSPVALVQACLAQIDRLDPELQAFVTADREGALLAAQQAEAMARSSARCTACRSP
jgi:Asp-tRNA(Asn)/Glu-tRNA(Gln) amidotransferase A subunit family amidase